MSTENYTDEQYLIMEEENDSWYSEHMYESAMEWDYWHQEEMSKMDLVNNPEPEPEDIYEILSRGHYDSEDYR